MSVGCLDLDGVLTEVPDLVELSEMVELVSMSMMEPALDAAFIGVCCCSLESTILPSESGSPEFPKNLPFRVGSAGGLNMGATRPELRGLAPWTG